MNFPNVFSLSLSVFSSLQKQKVVSFIWDGVARSLAKRWCSLSNAAKRSLFTRERVKIIKTKTRAESRDGKNSKKRNLNKNTKKKCFYENIRFFLSEPVRLIPGREFTYFFSEKAFACTSSDVLIYLYFTRIHARARFLTHTHI